MSKIDKKIRRLQDRIKEEEKLMSDFITKKSGVKKITVPSQARKLQNMRVKLYNYNLEKTKNKTK